MRKQILKPLMLLFLVLHISCKEEKKTENLLEKKEHIENIDYAEFKVINTEDLSRKAFGKKSLSEYSTTEIQNLPINKKMLYKIAFTNKLKEANLKPTIEKFINKLSSEDNDIDEIIINIYSDESLTNSSFDIGTAIWAKQGKLGNVDAEIAKGNDREGYEISYNLLNKDLDEYLLQKNKSENKFGLKEEERREFFKEIVKAEDKANEYKRNEEDKAFELNLSKEKLKIEYDKIDVETKRLMKKYKTEILKKYKITSEEEKEISNEAFNENWPLE
ncbi:hypothetical protein [Flavobacterium macrobrachii]|uniref:Lipoprotein n=1 Tax=Flavobacterium macrobrachii TaxID=591204 RepID=A0ABS2CUX6_9FLAO|nr:hypothetical protein [Flavobacterium macrobrachii]MBM6498027.1 hypothetical protein [Flavobacterium macrobrachii]